MMKQILYSITGVIIAFCIIDSTCGFVCEQLYHNAKYSLFARQNYVLNESEDDILIIGSSRAAHHYIPSIIEDSLGLSCYNAGSDGMCIYYHYALLSSVIERGHMPKMVVCEVMETDIVSSNSATFSLDAAVSRLAPEFGKYAAVDSLIALKGYTEMVYMHSALYRYNSQIVQLLRCNYSPQADDKGYERLDGIFLQKNNIAKNSVSDETLRIEKGKLECIKQLIKLCKNNGIALMFVYSPTNIDVNKEAVKVVMKIAQLEHIPFHNFYNNVVFCSNELFKDGSHLNHSGATLFTKLIVKKSKIYIIKYNLCLCDFTPPLSF